MDKKLKEYLSKIGRKGGKVKSEAKAKAARENGKKGGLMKKILLIALMGFLTGGCKGIQRLTTGPEGEMPQQSIPARSSVEGVLAGEHECVGVEAMDLSKGVTVVINGTMTLNKYEFELRPVVGQVCFKNQVTIQPDGTLLIPGTAATHAGDHYKITAGGN